MIHHNIWSCKDVQDHSSLSITWRKRWICQLIKHCVFHFETNFLITHIYLIEFIYFCHDRFNWPLNSTHTTQYSKSRPQEQPISQQIHIITHMDNMRHLNSIMLVVIIRSNVMILMREWEVKQRLQLIDQVYYSPSSTADIDPSPMLIKYPSTQIVFRNARDVLLFLSIE